MKSQTAGLVEAGREHLLGVQRAVVIAVEKHRNLTSTVIADKDISVWSERHQTGLFEAGGVNSRVKSGGQGQTQIGRGGIGAGHHRARTERRRQTQGHQTEPLHFFEGHTVSEVSAMSSVSRTVKEERENCLKTEQPFSVSSSVDEV
ncbi:hypothetical protein [Deinococcus sp. KNUC1210]|uniref:hypothetical protein n=1 Tax=Deinococcus sp. KNUC1210 TaxID=2917691 RepID=UPI00351D0868